MNPKRYCVRNNVGWSKPDNCLYVGNTGRAPSPWGNPYKVNRDRWRSTISIPNAETSDKFPKEFIARTHAEAVWKYRLLLSKGLDKEKLDDLRSTFRGQDVFCWCPTTKPCHGDILMDIANSDDDLAIIVQKLTDPTQYSGRTWATDSPSPDPPFSPMIYRIKVFDQTARLRLLQWLTRWAVRGTRVENLGSEGPECPIPDKYSKILHKGIKYDGTP